MNHSILLSTVGPPKDNRRALYRRRGSEAEVTSREQGGAGLRKSWLPGRWSCIPVSFRITALHLRPNRGICSPSPGQSPGCRAKLWRFPAQRANRSPRGTVGPLGRYDSHSVTDFPGRCPGLGEPMGLRPRVVTVRWNESVVLRNRRAERNFADIHGRVPSIETQQESNHHNGGQQLLQRELPSAHSLRHVSFSGELDHQIGRLSGTACLTYRVRMPQNTGWICFSLASVSAISASSAASSAAS